MNQKMSQTPSEKRVLVTGGGGFVCRHIIEALLRAGYDVVALDRAFDADLLAYWRTQWAGRVEILTESITDLPPMTVERGVGIRKPAPITDGHLRVEGDPLGWQDALG